MPNTTEQQTNRKIKAVVDMGFDDIPYSPETSEEQEKIEAVVASKYEKLCEDRSEGEAVDALMSEYGTLTKMAELAGYSEKQALAWRDSGDAEELKPVKKLFWKQRQRAYLVSFLDCALQQLCLLILQNRKHNSGSGVNKLYGILFDGAWLWEEYINTLIGEHFYHPRNNKKEGKQYLFEKARGEIYPDFISKNNNDRIIADAKYKPIENIGNKDYLQLLAYMFRFDSNKGYYFYPKASSEDDLVLKLNSGSTYEKKVVPSDDVIIIKHGLSVPDGAGDYVEFERNIKMTEKEFMRIIDIMP